MTWVWRGDSVSPPPAGRVSLSNVQPLDEGGLAHRALARPRRTTQHLLVTIVRGRQVDEASRPLRLAMIGTRGVPARYGGFETAIEEIGKILIRRGHQVTVFCRGGDPRLSSHEGMQLVHLPSIKRKVSETLSHTALSVLHREARQADVAFVFNAANAPLLPVLRSLRVPIAVHVDGLEWQRSKWSGSGRRYYRFCERLAVRWADELVSDARGIQDYYREQHGVGSRFIPYGAPILTNPKLDRLAELGLAADNYHLVVARFEPENHVDLIIEGYNRSRAALPLVVVGSAPYAEPYVARLQSLAAESKTVRMLGAVWDQELLDALYAGAVTYVHGHSVGGTNPSLLRAMGAGASVAAFDVVFNREVLGECGRFWGTSSNLADLLLEQESRSGGARGLGEQAKERAARAYTWPTVARGYELLAYDLAEGWSRRTNPTARPHPHPRTEATVERVLEQFGTSPEADSATTDNDRHA